MWAWGWVCGAEGEKGGLSVAYGGGLFGGDVASLSSFDGEILVCWLHLLLIGVYG